MERETKHAIVLFVALIAVVVLILGGVSHASGLNPPFTTVNSWSMQHGEESQLGVIDTGDMVLVKSPDKVDIVSYVEGSQTGYSKFGDYGDVIIYKRGADQNPVIHRAILYLEYNGNGTWNAPALKDFPGDRWSSSGGTGYNNLSGTLTISGLRYTHNINASLNLDKLAEENSHSGYVTMGDYNTAFDQSAGITAGLIENERIKSVAWIEVPWVGSIKMLWTDNASALDTMVPNSVPSLAVSLISIVFVLLALSFVYDHRTYVRIRKELEKDKMTPTPSFPLETEDNKK
ncbi:MAG: S26 family signal peptidase [Candidatus Methanoplasma sp.]|nr:S26 family signal peptidase [Candidatus Methanoplasma sp.]